MTASDESIITFPKKLLRPQEVAELLSCSVFLVRRLISNHKLPAIKISLHERSKKPRYVVRPEDLDTFIRSRYRQAPPSRPRPRPAYRRYV